MASTIRSARLDFSEDRLWPTEPLAGPTEEQTQPSHLRDRWHWEGLSAEIKLLAELEKDCGGQTKSEAQPTTTKLTDSDAEFRPVASNNKQPSLRKRAALGLARALIIFSMGVTATLAWQSYSDPIREMIATSHPQLGSWLAAETVGAGTTSEPTLPVAPATPSDAQEKTVAADTTSEPILPVAPAAPSGAQEKTVAADTTPEPILPVAPAANSDSQEINKAILMNLAAVRQSVDRLASRQQQMSNEIATLKAAEQNILRKISSAPPAQAAAAPARKPASRSPQDPTPLH